MPFTLALLLELLRPPVYPIDLVSFGDLLISWPGNLSGGANSWHLYIVHMGAGTTVSLALPGDVHQQCFPLGAFTRNAVEENIPSPMTLVINAISFLLVWVNIMSKAAWLGSFASNF